MLCETPRRIETTGDLRKTIRGIPYVQVHDGTPPPESGNWTPLAGRRPSGDVKIVVGGFTGSFVTFLSAYSASFCAFGAYIPSLVVLYNVNKTCHARK